MSGPQNKGLQEKLSELSQGNDLKTSNGSKKLEISILPPPAAQSLFIDIKTVRPLSSSSRRTLGPEEQDAQGLPEIPVKTDQDRNLKPNKPKKKKQQKEKELKFRDEGGTRNIDSLRLFDQKEDPSNVLVRPDMVSAAPAPSTVLDAPAVPPVLPTMPPTGSNGASAPSPASPSPPASPILSTLPGAPPILSTTLVAPLVPPVLPTTPPTGSNVSNAPPPISPESPSVASEKTSFPAWLKYLLVLLVAAASLGAIALGISALITKAIFGFGLLSATLALGLPLLLGGLTGFLLVGIALYATRSSKEPSAHEADAVLEQNKKVPPCKPRSSALAGTPTSLSLHPQKTGQARHPDDPNIPSTPGGELRR